MLLKEFICDLGYTDFTGDIENVEITGVSYNSSKVKKGHIFVAIKGFKTDGHKYIDNAIENGAVAVAVEEKREDLTVPQIVFSDTRKALALLSARFYDYPNKKLKLIGITGTNGKTTVTYLVKAILESRGYKVGLIGTNQNMVGNMILKSEHTTPESLELYDLFSIMLREGVEYVVMELSSHSLELNRVYGCSFEVGAFTNLTQDHLDFHITMENYAEAKAKLFSMCKHGIVNFDDEYKTKITEKADCSLEYYGINGDCDYKATNISYSAKGVSFIMNGVGFSLPTPGEFTIYNALCAVGICDKLGISPEKSASSLKGTSGVKGRAEIVDIPAEYTVMIDYAHTPDGIENIIGAVKNFCKGRVITLFGCGGDRDRTKRPVMGEIAGRMSDICIVTSDNPRTENPAAIIDDILAGIKKTGAEYLVEENRKEAIGRAMSMACKDDLVLLLGKGHETYQVLGDGIIDFDERKIAAEWFAKLNK